jgi:hypothetical protein
MAWHCGSSNCGTHSSPEHQCPSWQMARITTAVGGSMGYSFDKNVQIVQGTLNRFLVPLGGPQPRLATDGICGNKTLTALKNFQQRLGFFNPDGRVDINKRTHKALAAGPSGMVSGFFTYMVPNVPLIAQDNDKACWYASAQMLIQWRRHGMLSTLPGNPDPSEVPELAKRHSSGNSGPYSEDFRMAKGAAENKSIDSSRLKERIYGVVPITVELVRFNVYLSKLRV